MSGNTAAVFLDDGTMVVVDNARKMIGKTIDIAVTSVLQTTAGKMIFGKFDERAASLRPEPVPRKPAPPPGGPAAPSSTQHGTAPVAPAVAGDRPIE